MKAKRIDLDMKELEAIVERARSAPLSEQECQKLKAALETLVFLEREICAKGASIDRLRKLLFGPKTEKTAEVVGAAGDPPERLRTGEEAARGGRKGHGRNGAQAYKGAKKVEVPHESLNHGDRCPGCLKGKVYRMLEPAVLVRVVGQAPVEATAYELERLRCNLCLEVFTAKSPAGVGEKKYDETAASMIGLLKYGTGLPFNRLERLERALGIPLPAATQWEIVRDAARPLEPVYGELIRQAAQGEVVHNDDTPAKILERMGKRRQACEQDPSERTGLFTSGIVSRSEGRQIALFFTGQKHAGENLVEVLVHRAEELGAPIQMCDALSRNMPAELRTIVANCLAHARRQFVDVADNFPDECLYVLETLRDVYRNDGTSRQEKMSKQERLRFHQKQSGPLMGKLKKWLREQIAQKKVEPNSGLGKAFKYMVDHWKRLTLFLRAAGAPLDNNVVERALKKAILHRRNSYFYKTDNGAHVGDIFMTLIHTSELCGVNPFEYLVELLRHPEQLFQNPADWMPWNYCDMLARLSAEKHRSE